MASIWRYSEGWPAAPVERNNFTNWSPVTDGRKKSKRQLRVSDDRNSGIRWTAVPGRIKRNARDHLVPGGPKSIVRCPPSSNMWKHVVPRSVTFSQRKGCGKNLLGAGRRKGGMSSLICSGKCETGANRPMVSNRRHSHGSHVLVPGRCESAARKPVVTGRC